MLIERVQVMPLGGLDIRYLDKGEEKRLKSSDNPDYDFKQMMDKIAVLICGSVFRIDDSHNVFRVTGLTFQTVKDRQIDDDVDHVIITCKMIMANGRDATLVTPRLRLRSDGPFGCENDLIIYIERIISEVKAYIDGKRAGLTVL